VNSSIDEFMWNPYRFLISSMGSPTFFLGIAKRAIAKMLPTTAHQPDRTAT
jgi:hypothetical protein